MAYVQKFPELQSQFRVLLLFEICLVTARRQDVSAGTGFRACQCAGFSDRAAHKHKHLHKSSALGTFHLRQPGRPLSFLTTFYQHTITSPDIRNDSVLYFLLILGIAGKLSGQQVLLVFQPHNDNCRIKCKDDQRIP